MKIFRPITDSEKLWEALWLYNSWYRDDAYRILNEVARNVDRKDRDKEEVKYDGIKVKQEEEGIGYGDEDWYDDWR